MQYAHTVPKALPYAQLSSNRHFPFLFRGLGGGKPRPLGERRCIYILRRGTLFVNRRLQFLPLLNVKNDYRWLIVSVHNTYRTVPTVLCKLAHALAQNARPLKPNKSFLHPHVHLACRILLVRLVVKGLDSYLHWRYTRLDDELTRYY